MPTMTIKPFDKAVDAAQGATILQALLAAGVDVPHKCDSKAQCGTCHIFIQEGRKGLSKIGRAENEKLDSLVGVSAKSRLACQVVIGTDDFTVELLGFSSGL